MDRCWHVVEAECAPTRVVVVNLCAWARVIAAVPPPRNLENWRHFQRLRQGSE